MFLFPSHDPFADYESTFDDIRLLEEKETETYKEIRELKGKIEEVKKDKENLKMFWRCYMDYADPCERLDCPDKKFIDEWTDDEELRETLYEDFNIDEEEEEEEDISTICKDLVKTVIDNAIISQV